MKPTLTLIVLLLMVVGCDYCKIMYGEEDLGNRFMLINENIERVYINYCTSEKCCTSGFSAIPSKVLETEFDEDWIIARVENKDSTTFWIIDKSYNPDLNRCEETNCYEELKLHISGPLNHKEFRNRVDTLKIDLSFN